MPHRIYRGTKVYFIRNPHPHLYRGPPSGHASPLDYFDRVIFFLITRLQLVEENQAYLGHRANRQVKIDKRLVKDHFRGVGAPEISVNPPWFTHKWQWKEQGRAGRPLPLEFLLIWGRLDKRRNLC
jgi:hypothetical protein